MLERYRDWEIEKIWSDQKTTELWLDVARSAAWAQGVDRSIGLNVLLLTERRLDLEREIGHEVIAMGQAVLEQDPSAGKWWMLGIASQDLVDNAQSQQINESSRLISERVNSVIGVLQGALYIHRDQPWPARTHGRLAEPINFGHVLNLWIDALVWADCTLDSARCDNAVGRMRGPVGMRVMRQVFERDALKRLSLRPVDVCSQIIPRHWRNTWADALVHTSNACELVATEIRLNCIEGVDLMTSRGSSSASMPHKRGQNPVVAEKICGLARLVRGHRAALAEGTASWWQRDMSSSSVERIVWPDMCHVVMHQLKCLERVLIDLEIHFERAKSSLGPTTWSDMYKRQVGGESYFDLYKEMEK